MDKENFLNLGRVEAINKLYEGSPYKYTELPHFEASAKSQIQTSSRTFLEGIDFDLTYFPLKHLGYKTIVAVTGELYAKLSHPQTLVINLSVSSKLDFEHIKDIWEGMVTAAKEHGYKAVTLDLTPSIHGLIITVSASGETSNLIFKRRPGAKSMDLICVSDNLGAAFLGLQVLEREKRDFLQTKNNEKQPELEEYKHMIGAYLKPSLNPSIVGSLEDAEIIPSYGYFVNKGLADTIKKLTRDSGFGAKVYADKLPFAGNTFDLCKELNIDPISVAMNGGEDYRLLFTIPIDKHEKFRRDFQTFDIIGHLALPEVGSVLVTPDGLELPIKAQGW